jgi:two-component system response regulator HydG
MPTVDGIELCSRIVGNHPTLPVLLMTAYGDVEAAVAAIRAGAHDFIAKPFSNVALADAVKRALAAHTRSRATRRVDAPPVTSDDLGLVGSSPAMTEVREQVRRLAATDCTVLISGESGTGKELVARALHSASLRRQAPYVPLNCAAIPGHLLESEMFGHAKGAFTGATSTRDGLVAAAAEGTLFLDEIGTMPLELQPKLLRTLQQRTWRAVGGTQERTMEARIIAATNTDLASAVARGAFRKDLFYRLDVASIHLPPLRDRAEDVGELFRHFLSTGARGRAIEVSEEAVQRLTSYAWPGNVRELQNCVLAGLALTRDDGRIGFEELPSRIRKDRAFRKSPPTSGTYSLGAVERAHIESVLMALAGNKAKAATVLGIDRSTLYRKLRRYGLDRSIA